MFNDSMQSVDPFEENKGADKQFQGGHAKLFQINKSFREISMISSTNEATTERGPGRLHAFCSFTLVFQHIKFGCKSAQKQDEGLLLCQCRWS